MRDDAKDLKKLLWAVVLGLGMNAVISGFNAYESHQANAHATKAEDILASRDFSRLFAEHEQHHREHAEILKRCGD